MEKGNEGPAPKCRSLVSLGMTGSEAHCSAEHEALEGCSLPEIGEAAVVLVHPLTLREQVLVDEPATADLVALHFLADRGAARGQVAAEVDEATADVVLLGAAEAIQAFVHLLRHFALRGLTSRVDAERPLLLTEELGALELDELVEHLALDAA